MIRNVTDKPTHAESDTDVRSEGKNKAFLSSLGGQGREWPQVLSRRQAEDAWSHVGTKREPLTKKGTEGETGDPSLLFPPSY